MPTMVLLILSGCHITSGILITKVAASISVETPSVRAVLQPTQWRRLAQEARPQVSRAMEIIRSAARVKRIQTEGLTSIFPV